LIDGSDEISSDQYQIALEFLKSILEIYPKLRVIVTTSPGNFSGLTQLGLVPVSLASWNEDMTFAFLKSFTHNWKQYIQSFDGKGENEFDSLFIQNWLKSYNIPQGPMELTLKVWSAYAGDMLGPDFPANLEAYIRRTSGEYSENRYILEKIAAKMIFNEKFTISQEEILALFDKQIQNTEADITDDEHISEIETVPIG
jgi:hypothetical protein